MIKFIEIESIEIINNEDIIVNDISVENEHNYIANNYCVHNCTTSSNTSIHYPIASLIQECRDYKDAFEREHDYIDFFPKIIADGGIRNYSDVIKALGLGADYVMIGGLFAGMYESAAPLLVETNEYNYNGQFIGTKQVLTDYQYTNEEKKRNDIRNRRLFKECYGMSTKKAQELIDPNKTKKTAEGKHSIIEVKYTINQWTENMIDYLKSAMSYCNAHNLEEFIGKQEFILNSPGTMLAVNK